MGAEGRISASIGSERKERLKKVADASFNGSMTAALNAAIDSMTEEEARERASIPPVVIDSIDYIRLILRTGEPAQDWQLIQQEVEKLWQNTRS